MPKPYIRKMPATWWLKKPAYFYFMLRELTAVFVAAYCVILLVMVYRLKQGPLEFATFLEKLQTWWSISFHVIAFLMAVYHSCTWFNLTPKVMVLRRGEDKVPPILLVAGNYVAWLVVSVVLVIIVF